MVRVLHALGRMNMGGIESFIMNVYRAIDRGRVQFDFLVSARDNKWEPDIKALGGRIYYIPPRNESLSAYRKNVDRFFSEHASEYGAVHVHVSSLSSVYILKAAGKHGIRTRIIHGHSTGIKGSSLHYLLHWSNKPRLSRLATHCFACSDKARRWLFAGTGCLSGSEIINNGIITDDFTYNPQKRLQARRMLGIGDDIIAVCHVGSFIEVKNHDFLLDIFGKLKALDERYVLFLVGDGPLRPMIEEKAAALGLEDSVVMLGLRDDVSLLMQGFDCLVFPSLFEGLPVTLVEAQASDLKVVCSDTISRMAAISDDIRFVSLNTSPSEWARIIDGRIGDGNRKNNSELIRRAGFDIHAIADRLQKLYVADA